MTNSIGYFIDKLNVAQEHYTNELPMVGKDMIIIVDLETGDERRAPSKLQLEGSYSSSLMIRCNGSRVEVYGNPSRYHRIDNLFGFMTFDECIAVYNQVLLKLGLPPFTKCKKLMSVQNEATKKVSWLADGACIKHVDFTINHSVGEGNEQKFLRALSGQTIGRAIKPYLYPNGNTVDWFGKNLTQNGSTHRYIKCYAKSIDLERHQKRNLKKSNHVDQVYYQKIIDYSKQQGVVREEHSFKNRWLKDQCLFAYGLIKENQFQPYLTCIDDARNRLEVNKVDPLEIERELIELEIVKTAGAAQATQAFYLYWMMGKSLIKNETFYRHCRRLLQLGIDIRIPCDLTRSPVQFKETEFIEVKPLAVPDWYKMPDVNHLKLVA
jgi:Phage X family/Phage replication protein CRI